MSNPVGGLKELLGQADVVAAPRSDVAPAPQPEIRTEDLQPPVLLPNPRPPKAFKWLDEKDFAIENLLAGNVQATLEVVSVGGSMNMTFREWTEDERCTIEMLLAPKVNGNATFFLSEQISRAVTIGLIATAIVKWDGKDWEKGKPVEERIAKLRSARSVAIMDRIVRAFGEFHEHLVWLSKELDPKD